jgi:RNA-binding protein 8A
LDRQTGYVKGYALVEYEKFEDADRAKREVDGTEFLGQILSADFAFVHPVKLKDEDGQEGNSEMGGRHNSRADRGQRGIRSHSKSPHRR